jgi:hypothetical protein
VPTVAISEAELARLVAAGRVTVGPRVSLGPPPAPVPDVLEEDFLQAVRALAREHGWTTYHTRDSRKSDAGFPDLVLVRGRRLLWVELKTETGELSAAQRGWRDSLLAAGQDWRLWRPSDWATITETLSCRS